MNIGKNIRHIRELKNKNQSFVAEHLGMSLGGYSKIETGQSDVSFSKLVKIAEVLETDLNTLLNFDPKNIIYQCNNTNSVISGSVGTLNVQKDAIELLSKIENDIVEFSKRSKK